MRMIWFFLFGLCAFNAAYAAEAISGDTVCGDDGQTVRLLGIQAEGDDARNALQSLVAQDPLRLESAARDRYGRLVADIYVHPKTGHDIWLQGEMLRQGLAFVYPAAGTEPHLQALLRQEQIARRARRGLWGMAAYADLPADDPANIHYGRYAFVSGRVMTAERIKNKLYLSFGNNWHSDFTATIAAHDLRAFHKAGLDPLTLEGKTVRVRGWVNDDSGPMMTLTHPAQIEIAGATGKNP